MDGGTITQSGQPLWGPIDIEVQSNFPVEILEANIRANAKRDLPFVVSWGFPITDEPLAIVGGGPSLNSHLDELRKFKHVMVCGSAHDHLIAKGIKPEFAVFCDAMPSPPFFDRKTPDCTYLLATQCDGSLFDHLSDCTVWMWDIDGCVDSKVFEKRGRINGGSTAAMRAPALGMVLGFRDFHFFGVDSSFEDENRHAYEYTDESDILPTIDAQINGRTFRTTKQFIAQAQDLQKILTHCGHLFSVKVYGDTLLGAVWKDMRAKADLLMERAA